MAVLRAIGGMVGSVILCIGAAQAEVRSSISHQTYSVDGASLPAVWQDISHKAPQVLRNGDWHAETRIRYRWSVRYVAVGSGCAAKQPVVDVSVTIILPEWTGARSAPTAVQAAWRHYRDNLYRHEEQHRDIALDTAQKLHALLSGAPRNHSCNELAKAIGRGVERILADEQRQQNHYDRVAWPIRLL